MASGHGVAVPGLALYNLEAEVTELTPGSGLSHPRDRRECEVLAIEQPPAENEREDRGHHNDDPAAKQPALQERLVRSPVPPAPTTAVIRVVRRVTVVRPDARGHDHRVIG